MCLCMSVCVSVGVCGVCVDMGDGREWVFRIRGWEIGGIHRSYDTKTSHGHIHVYFEGDATHFYL